VTAFIFDARLATNGMTLRPERCVEVELAAGVRVMILTRLRQKMRDCGM